MIAPIARPSTAPPRGGRRKRRGRGRQVPRVSAIWELAIAQTIVWAGLFYSFPALILRWETDFGWAKAELTGAVTLSIALSAVFSPLAGRSEEHTSELQSLMRISYAVFCLKKKTAIRTSRKQ